MKRKLLLVAGCVISPLPILCLHYGLWLALILCPHALALTFLRQSNSSPDSLAAADYPEFAVALGYFPFVGWLLSGAQARGKLARTAARIGVWHGVAMGAALGALLIRNTAWFGW